MKTPNVTVLLSEREILALLAMSQSSGNLGVRLYVKVPASGLPIGAGSIEAGPARAENTVNLSEYANR